LGRIVQTTSKDGINFTPSYFSKKDVVVTGRDGLDQEKLQTVLNVQNYGTGAHWGIAIGDYYYIYFIDTDRDKT